MLALHLLFMDAVAEECQHLVSRRTLLGTGSKLAIGGAVAAAVASSPALARLVAAQEFTDDIDVLNYALTLEHLEYAFYRDGLDSFTADDFDEGVYGNLVLVRDHEGAHVDVLVSTITDLGGEPAEELMYSFGITDVDSYVATAQVLENLGTGAYTGAAQFLTGEDALLTAALTIHGVEARHASYLNFVNGDVPFPEAFEPAIPPADVLEAATPLIVSEMPATGTGPITGRDSENPGILAAAGAVALGAAALAIRARKIDGSTIV